MKTKIFLFWLAVSANIYSQNSSGEVKNLWQVGLTFGEIPILAGSFKPGIQIDYHLNDNIAFEFTIQLKDYLERNEESFNAVNTGLGGLLSSKETTGERIYLGICYKPYEWSPYLTGGFVFNGSDVETMKFDERLRGIGDNKYNSKLTIIQKRESGFAPAIGFGYQYDFDGNLSINTSFAMAFFSQIPKPEIAYKDHSNISVADLNTLSGKLVESYKDNFHNRYHIFNIGINYRFN